MGESCDGGGNYALNASWAKAATTAMKAVGCDETLSRGRDGCIGDRAFVYRVHCPADETSSVVNMKLGRGLRRFGERGAFVR